MRLKHWIIAGLGLLLLLPCTVKQSVKLQAGLPVDASTPQGKQMKTVCSVYATSFAAVTSTQSRRILEPNANPVILVAAGALADQVLIEFLNLPPPHNPVPIYIWHAQYLI